MIYLKAKSNERQVQNNNWLGDLNQWKFLKIYERKVQSNEQVMLYLKKKILRKEGTLRQTIKWFTQKTISYEREPRKVYFFNKWVFQESLIIFKKMF